MPGSFTARARTPRCETPKARCETLEARCETLEARCETPKARCETLKARCETLEARCEHSHSPAPCHRPSRKGRAGDHLISFRSGAIHTALAAPIHTPCAY
eukprot:scaffold35473_cov62-Isochrysis_galbana.AAC.1